MFTLEEEMEINRRRQEAEAAMEAEIEGQNRRIAASRKRVGNLPGPQYGWGHRTCGAKAHQKSGQRPVFRITKSPKGREAAELQDREYDSGRKVRAGTKRNLRIA